MPPNRLAGEKSPYLLQHAGNPVDWYPWGEEAFSRARNEGKPVFLSIGYSTCHWCHVMERESFENREIAELINSRYVPIKVDREERPDVDAQYMTAVQGLVGNGGWPLTAILTPEGKPFFGGTYFPPDDRFGRPGLRSLLLQLDRAWREQRTEVLESAERVTDFVRSQVSRRPGELDASTLELGTRHLHGEFDETHGGFGSAPKFPRPHLLTFLLRRHSRTGDPAVLNMVERSLDAMAAGGIHDHLGGGFARYSTDREWLVPHFEKMLYDQALLARAYLEAYQVTGHERHALTARGIFEYVLRDLRDSRGGFHSAEDADSEGEEGRFYVWRPEEIDEALGGDEAEIFRAAYGVTAAGNFEGGRTVLSRVLEDDELATRFTRREESIRKSLAGGREALWAHRERRIRPHLDDKVLTDWNGLMIAALAQGGRVLQEARYTRAAEEAARFVLETLRDDGDLLHRYRDGESGIRGFLDDHAFLGLGLLELYLSTQDPGWLEPALDLARELVRRFEDPEGGGFFFTSEDHEQLLARDKQLYDGALPSGNSVAAGLLVRLGALAGDPELTRAGERTLEAFGGQIAAHPSAFPESLNALDFVLGPTAEVVVAAASDGDADRFLLPLTTGFHPRVLHARAVGEALSRHLPFTAGMRPFPDGGSAAYVCVGGTCELPVRTPEEMQARIQRVLDPDRP